MHYFTPESATRTLPLVRRIVKDLVALQVELVFRGERIDKLARQHNAGNSAAHSDELNEMRMSLQRDKVRIDDVVREIAAIGAVIDSPADGSVDFPAMAGDREIRLCWKPGDGDVSHWHELDQPASKRRPISEISDILAIPASNP